MKDGGREKESGGRSSNGRGALSHQLRVVPLIAPDHACRLAGVPLERALQDGRTLAGVLLAARERYGHDMVVVFCDVNVEAEALGAELEFAPGAFPTVRKPVALDAGAWDFDPRRGRIRVVLEAVRRCRQTLGPDAPLAGCLKGPFSLAALALGAEEFLGWPVSCPAKAKEALERAASFQSEYARAMALEGAVPWFGDPFASEGLLGARWFRDLALQPLREAVSAATSAAGMAGLHVCGETAGILDDLASTGARWVSLEFKGAARVKAHFPDALLFGGVPTDFLLDFQPAEVRRFCRDSAKLLPPGCALASDCDVPEMAPPENIQAMVDGAREGFLEAGVAAPGDDD